MSRLPLALAPVLTLALAGPAVAQIRASVKAGGGALTQAEKKAAARITPASIAAGIRFLADDLLEGRAPGSRGDHLAQRYIAAELEAAGLSPGGPGGSWFQPVPLMSIRTTTPASVRLTAGGKALDLKSKVDLVVSTGVQRPTAAIRDAEVVFVGYGIVAPEYGWDDYAGVDVRGKVVLVMNNDPANDPRLFGGPTRLYYGRWGYKYEEAARHGAVGAIVIHTTESAAYPWSVVTTSNGEEEFDLVDKGGEARLEAKMWATEDASRRIAALGGKDLDALRAAAGTRPFKATPLGVKVSLSLVNKLRKVESANVIGVLPGSDPKLKDEVVIYTAHHDHLGVGPAREGDSIYNGALDNASGVAAMLSIARAAAAGPAPRRSLLFMTVAAEEQGLLGSEWYARNPTFAPGRIAANLNIDGVNKDGRTSDLGFIGFGKSSLDAIVVAVARAQGRTVLGDPQPDRGSFYRSDQFNFARIGVPAVYAQGGPTFIGRPPGWGKQQDDLYVAKHYHQPSDEFDGRWDLSGAVEDAQLYLVVGGRIANAPAMPAWKPGDEFEAARKAARKAVGR